MAVAAVWSMRLRLGVLVGGVGRWVASLVVIVVAPVVLVAALSGGAVGGRVTPRSLGRGAAGLARLESLPLQAQSVISTAVGAGSPMFAPGRSAAGYRLRGGGVSALFGRNGVVVRAGPASLSLRSLAVGPGVSRDRLGVLSVAARGGRVVYDRGVVAEWYAAGPLGVEQGFTVRRRPSGVGRVLTLAVGFRGGLRARQTGSSVQFLTGSGRVALRYGGLSATDARGRALPVTLKVRNRELLLGVSDGGARYPLRIDPLVQQGSKLTGNGEGAASEFGYSVSLSGNGDTALVGAPGYNGNAGAAWVFTLSGSTWSQQAQLIGDCTTTTSPGSAPVGCPGPDGTGENGPGQFGDSVALSLDGEEALIGAPFDNGGEGAAWVFTLTGSTWAQQGQPLYGDCATTATPCDGPDGIGESGDGQFGSSVALSANGDSALVGAPEDDGGIGAAWLFTLSGSIWSQSGSKLTGNGETGSSEFGASVALDNDGATALIGAPEDSGGIGAAWVFTSGAGSSQKLIGAGESGLGLFGSSVALSLGGDTAMIGAPHDDNAAGAAWVFARSGSAWSQQGTKLVADCATSCGGPLGTGENGPGQFGYSVALSPDGSRALIGAPADTNNPDSPTVSGVGAAWMFAAWPAGAPWRQQDVKATGNDESGNGDLGYGVALSLNGDTALVGGPDDTPALGGGPDDSGAGAAWAFNNVVDQPGLFLFDSYASQTTATFAGSVDPFGQYTQYFLAYDTEASPWCSSAGTSGSYEATTPETLGYTDLSGHPVSVTITGLAPGETYCWTVIAVNASGTTQWPVLAFQTQTPPKQAPLEVLVTAARWSEGGNALSMTVECPAACSGTVTVSASVPVAAEANSARSTANSKKKRRTKTVRLGRGHFVIRVKGSEKVTVHLTKAGKRLLAAHHGRLKATVLVSEKSKGRPVLSTHAITIVPAKQKK